MPNTLAHLGLQTLASRAVMRRADVRWIFLGAIIPDVPWIAGRATSRLVPGLHDNDLWAYYIAQSSLAVSLLLCGALAALAERPRRTFLLLAFNAFLHLLLDGLQTRWGNGVHLFAPFSWEFWNAGWFGFDSWPVMSLTILGAIVAVFAVREASRSRPTLDLSRGRLAWAALLLSLYLLVPIHLRAGPMSASDHALSTLREETPRTGRRIELDRTAYVVRGDDQFVHTYGGDVLRAVNRPATVSTIMSLRAVFLDDSTLTIESFEDHAGSGRDLLNYLGLAFIAMTLVAGPGVAEAIRTLMRQRRRHREHRALL